MRRRVATAVALALSMVVGTFQLTAAAPPTDTSALRDAVSVEGIMEHEAAFQEIAEQNNDTRASGTPGYDESADYVAGLLEGAGYDVTRQEFDYEQFSETAEPVLDPTSPDLPPYTPGEDFATMEYSGSGDVTAPLQAVDVTIPPGAAADSSTSGCEASDFAGFTAGNIALIQRGTCTFRAKADNAAAAGAVGVIIFNEGQEGRTDAIAGTLSSPQVSLPVVGASFAVGEELYNLLQQGPVTARLATFTLVETTTTENVLADTPSGREDRTVVVGAHLDSVLEGPGINDNGSGSSTILEIALQMAELDIAPTNQVRFAFWGAEESGLIGSEYYVSQLTKRDLKDIAVNLNFDMVGSPNYVRFVYDGDGSDTPVAGPTGSAQVEDVFLDYFESVGLETDPTAFDGRSDYGPFIAVGIPAGGLFTGAEGVKTEEQAAVYGGIAGLAYDPCYHQACDDLVEPNEVPELETAYGSDVLVGNVNTQAIDEMSDAAAHAVFTFTMTGSAVPGTGKGPGPSTKSLEFLGHQAKR
ncbi:MAG: M20/M25/M40 family metallo-hydrolase [Actinobacteria bacterium]|nr:M20/M25/M40 family metallo-hydrolase [Actinomycetota bacterium]